MRIVAAISGGVDSAVAAAMLRDDGHDVVCAYLRNGVEAGPAAARARQGCCGVVDAADAARVADLLGLPYYALDFAEDFGRIVRDFGDEYSAGRTPHPCVLCNRDLKFGRLLRFAEAIGATAVATGHYAVLARRPSSGGDGRFAIRVPRDRRKDQTYVLFPLGQDQLARTLFPLSDLTKEDVREEARRRRLPVAEKPESMELCFVPGGDYRAVLARIAPLSLHEGDVIDESSGQVVGRHGGVATVTPGQRRGVGTNSGVGTTGAEPRYVTRIDAPGNRVFVGPAAACLRRVVTVARWNGVALGAPAVGESIAGRAKVRRTHEPQRCVATGLGGGRVEVRFDEPVASPAPGQTLVLYDEEGWVLGGGWIESAD